MFLRKNNASDALEEKSEIWPMHRKLHHGKAKPYIPVT